MTAATTESMPLRRLRTRGQFLKAARGKRAGRPSFALQAVTNASDDIGVGFTVTKKMGNAPARNRIKRRLRAAVTECAGDFVSGNDYVLVGRREALAEPFAALTKTLRRAIARVVEAHTPTKPSGNGVPGPASDHGS